jgi:predicted enzyme related to lactoylglutathione lyase
MNRASVGTCLLIVALAACDQGTVSEQDPMQDQQVDTTMEATEMSQADQDRRVDYIEFGTTDIEAIKRFYVGVFGWEFVDYGPTYTSFLDGRMAGGFDTSTEVSTGGPLVVLYALDLEGIQASVLEHGGTIARGIFAFPGGRRFHFQDPSGNELAVWSDQ